MFGSIPPWQCVKRQRGVKSPWFLYQEITKLQMYLTPSRLLNVHFLTAYRIDLSEILPIYYPPMPWVVGGARKKSLPANWVNKTISIHLPFVGPPTPSYGDVYSSKLCPSKGGQTMSQFSPSRHGADSSLEHSLELQHPKLHLALLCLHR